MSRAMLALAALTACLAGTVGGYWYGHDQGVLAESARRDGRAVKDLGALIESHKGLIRQAAAASKAMRTAVARRAAQDAQSTQEIRDALTATAASRDGCVFPAGVMRQLADARERAAQAAAGGVRGALPGASSSAAPDR